MNETTETTETTEMTRSNVDDNFDMYLDKLYQQLSDKNKSILKAKVKLPTPKLTQLGKIRTVWENFQQMQNKLNRPTEHLRQFFADELGMECSLSQKDPQDPVKLVIKGKGRLKNSGILKILSSYIDTFVQCNVCGEMDTVLNKEQRQYFVTCNKCLSKYCCQI